MLLPIVVIISVLCIFPWIIYVLLRLTKRTESNFLGVKIPTSFGLSILVGADLLLLTSNRFHVVKPPAVACWLLAVNGFGLLGLLDDLLGDKKIKGLRGHLKSALVDRKITTGFVKASGGVVLGLIIGRLLFPAQPVGILLSGATIALGANMFNLLDLRPGRSAGCFLAASGILLVCVLSGATRQSEPLLLSLVLIPTLPVWILDSRARVMMGDTGSNLLGASLGLAAAEVYSYPLLVTCCVLLVGLHAFAEKRSLTRVIAENRVLDKLDRLTGVRE